MFALMVLYLVLLITCCGLSLLIALGGWCYSLLGNLASSCLTCLTICRKWAGLGAQTDREKSSGIAQNNYYDTYEDPVEIH